jgi:MinD superfamily P-loop ATPase
MKQILFLSGKGGTGKTSLAGAFAALMQDMVLADCDVDAANLHLLLKATPIERGKYEGSKEAIHDRSVCQRCGKCVDVCRFHAIRSTMEVDPLLCEGCGACVTACPEGAMSLRPRVSGHWLVAETPVAPLVTAELLPGEEASGKLVTFVKRRATDLAEARTISRVVVDGSPGIGCPVIASTSGVDLAVLVTEPSLSGLHDLERILGVVRHFGIEARLVINKYDLSPEVTRQLEQLSDREGVGILGKIPYDPAVPKALVEGESVVKYPESPAGSVMRRIVDRVLALIGEPSNEKGQRT